MRKVPVVFFCTIIGLALFGIVFQMTTNPLQFLGSIFTTVIVASVVITVIYFLFVRPKGKRNPMNKYKQAVKQSKRKYGGAERRTTQKGAYVASTSRAKKRPSHLRVIEGNKSK